MKPHEPLEGANVYDRLCEEIRGGAFEPGARLLETELAERLGVSRTPVREALRKLEADGLVTMSPRAGAAVRRLDYGEIAELYEMRAILEGAAARMAARVASEMEREELSAINQALEAAIDDPRQAARLNREFHLVLHAAAKNRFLERAMAGLQKTLSLLGPSTLAEAPRARGAVEEHRAVLRAIEARDEAAAEAAMRGHITEAQRSRLRQARARLARLDGENEP